MSYDLYICTPPLPASDVEAWKLYGVAGNPDPPAEKDLKILTNGFHLMVKENEQQSASQVTEIITAYAKRERRPKKFAWRETH